MNAIENTKPEAKVEAKANDLKELNLDNVKSILDAPQNAEKLKLNFSKNLEKELTKDEA